MAPYLLVQLARPARATVSPSQKSFVSSLGGRRGPETPRSLDWSTVHCDEYTLIGRASPRNRVTDRHEAQTSVSQTLDRRSEPIAIARSKAVVADMVMPQHSESPTNLRD